jgi:uncharacterized C2H2 Zn-finger protein
MIYNCNNCDKIFAHKNDYIRHINRKFPCTKNIQETCQNVPENNRNVPETCQNTSIIENKKVNDDTNKIIACPHCQKVFSSSSCRSRHINGGRCLVKNKEVNEIEQLKDDLKQTKDELHEIKELLKTGTKQTLSKIINSHNNNNNTNSNNTLNNVVNINVFGKEDVSHITNETYKQIFRRCKNSVPAFIKIKHFSSKKPENSNIYISDLKGQYAVLYNGEQWNIEDKNEMLQNLYDTNCGQLMDKYADMKDELDEITVRKYDRFVETMDEPETENNAKEEIKKILYNDKEKSIRNRKSLKLLK